MRRPNPSREVGGVDTVIDEGTRTGAATSTDAERDGSVSPLVTDLSTFSPRLAEEGADALVVVGDRFDADLQYLTRLDGFQGRVAIVVTTDAAVLCPSEGHRSIERARERFVDTVATAATSTTVDDGLDRSIRTDDLDAPVGKRAASIVTDLVGDTADILVPRTIPHDAVVYLEDAGHALTSTTAIREARAVKSGAEIDRLRRVQAGAARGMDRAATILAEGRFGSDDPRALLWDGEPLSVDRLRREMNAAMALAGVDAAGNTTVQCGSRSGSDATGEPLRAGEPIVIGLAPHGPDGYYGALARTFVVDGDGGWERRAHLAVESAREAGIDAIEPGVRASILHEEVAAEIGAYGFDLNPANRESGLTHDAGHGVGLERREAPALTATADLRPNTVLAIDASVRDPDVGRVRLRDLLVVTDSAVETLVNSPTGIVPERR
ncbi:M24 family metallopeptidase [Halopenitus sp. H-Gu1]|uniref:M24 family metallopeptidase n=1 Tax=Halopenitus sp. H-Gu1 TaxID=3242697 RepID=UPI00359CBD86